ncbi:ThuA domain-containing protein [Domibacillus mangrovi]|uniref:Trehalose utilization protein ThuA n=1 Tax=Domibacillus mangrovi TaxID=1714354 RepID=A0A1Q5P019_9BACI|nr:ThuA domain-containing protein [Domibacillus mangrovi]OKL35513.1 trehalose utilization protein ThuA [Domibacillus mangrovi]
MNVTVWNEYRHEKTKPLAKNIYPEGIHQVIARFLKKDRVSVKTATLDEIEHGLTEDVLDSTDVLIWWGHVAHEEVSDEIVGKVQQRVLEGMGLIVLHSGHFSKIFKSLMGTTCDLKWREAGEKERIWVIDPAHPIAAGIGEYFELEQEEMYGEHFDIPAPDELVFMSWFEGGEVFRSGMTYKRGNGKIFYFRPGHETYPTYYNENVQTIIKNAVKWAAPVKRKRPVYGNAKPIEMLKGD